MNNDSPLTASAITRSEDESLGLGGRIASLLRIGDVVALDGPLGVGKTRIAAGILMQLGVSRDDITSPTFTLIHEFPTEPPIAHLDAYRLADSDEFLGLGVSELWDDGIVLVEWGSKVLDALPRETLLIEGAIDEADRRLWSFSADVSWSDRWNQLAEAIALNS